LDVLGLHEGWLRDMREVCFERDLERAVAYEIDEKDEERCCN
jgi:hypothetical protein